MSGQRKARIPKTDFDQLQETYALTDHFPSFFYSIFVTAQEEP